MKNNNWKYTKKFSFEYQQDFADYKRDDCAWIGHVFFAYDLVRNVKSKIIVELGTHNGTSFFSLCQAVKDHKLNSQVFAVDTWKGDEHSDFYGEEVFSRVQTLTRKYYGNINARLVRKTFDEASSDPFAKNIDILHIDGYHTYEAVKHDFETWFDKLTPEATVLFHDIKVADFGIWKFWNELKEKYPNALFLEFSHSYGLGIFIQDKSLIEKIKQEGEKDFIKKYEEKYRDYYMDKFFFLRYDYIGEINTLQSDISEYIKQIEDLKYNLKEKEDNIISLNNNIKEKEDNIISLNNNIKEKEDNLKEAASIIAYNESAIENLKSENSFKDKELQALYRLRKKKLFRIYSGIKNLFRK